MLPNLLGGGRGKETLVSNVTLITALDQETLDRDSHLSHNIKRHVPCEAKAVALCPVKFWYEHKLSRGGVRRLFPHSRLNNNSMRNGFGGR